MHIKTGTWEASNSVCQSDSLCDPAVLVSATNSDPHIRNRRLSPGSSNCEGGGGGGCSSGNNHSPRQLSPKGDVITSGNTVNIRKEKERKGQQHKSRSLRRENQKGKPHKVSPKERWVEDSLSLLKPPPAFPVQDSPAKLQPAVSYASKVKAGAATGALEEDRPAIGVLLQNQWGLSFISDTRSASDARSPVDPSPTEADPVPRAQAENANGELLLSCRHLVEALNYHTREWNTICTRQKKDPKKVLWYKETQEQPA